MAIQGLSPAERRQLRLPAGRGGVVVTNVTRLGQAAQAGIVEDDVILSIAGSPVSTPGDVTQALGRLTNGRIARLIVWRMNGDRAKNCSCSSQAVRTRSCLVEQEVKLEFGSEAARHAVLSAGGSLAFQTARRRLPVRLATAPCGGPAGAPAAATACRRA
jgi:C-terminal processing protease CtpA/Prc